MSSARDRFDRGSIRANPEIGMRKAHGLREPRPGDFIGAPTASEIDPAINKPLRRVDPTFQRARLESGEQSLSHLSPTVAIAVGEEHNVWRARHNDAASRGDESISWREVGGPN